MIWASILGLLVFIVLALYMLPSLLAWQLKHPRRVAITFVNALFGWVLLVWFALIFYLQLELQNETT
ncbi:MAG: superinfection immunity protein [Acidobacteriota bacterium]|nr:superinfection immunity protein [Acidobacteriota bacterium]